MKKLFTILLTIIILISNLSSSVLSFSSKSLTLDSKENKYLSNGGLAESGLKITYDTNYDLSSKYFGFVNLCFENTSDRLIILENFIISTGDTLLMDTHLNIVSPEMINIWQLTMNEILKINHENEQSFLKAMSFIGSLIPLISKDVDISNVAKTISGISAIGYVLNEYEKENLTDNAFPQNHLLSEEVVVLPGLSTRRWVLLNSNNHDKLQKLSNIILTYFLKNTNSNETVKLPFKEENEKMRGWKYDYLKLDLEDDF